MPEQTKESESRAPLFAAVSSHARFPEMEERVLEFWKRENIFDKSVQQRAGGPRYTVYEGPPTANGSPGIHHVLSRVFKDIFPRYKTMKGYHSPRKGGWDTHGLPIELEVEKQLGIRSKAEIEEHGLDRFNDLCRSSVFRYVKEWEELTDRVGFWTDMENAYVTYENGYVETGWWIIKTLWEAGLVYRGRRVAPHCPRCGTTLSSHEVALGYRENTRDPSVYVKFEVAAEEVPEAIQAHINDRTYLLAWTTTPWTLPGNTGLAVSPDDIYVVLGVSDSGERLILAEALVKQAVPGEHQVLARFPGSDLVGLRYRPLYDPLEYGAELLRFVETGSNELAPVSYRPQPLTYPVISADFVSMDDGTGIVHSAPSFGEDDYNAGSSNGLYFVQPVDLTGTFVGTYPWAGQFVKDADAGILRELKERGLLYRRETIEHTYPFCWRCDSPLLYYAKTSWYLRTSLIKDRLLSANEEITWYPDHIKNGRFGEWLRGNVDWAISRERYWGTPWPVWECSACSAVEAIGSRDELRGKPGIEGFHDGIDLHRPQIDAVTYRCAACHGVMRRLPDVIDCWFDSGAMPLAQWHYPFENAALIDGGEWYPADFICEAVDQTRGWFYSLHAIAALVETATHGRISAPSYRHVVSLGLILDAKGEKMSKSRGNVVDPFEVVNTHGADAVRWYLYSAAPAGNNRRFSADLVAEGVRKFLLTLWNTYSFFVTYANIDGYNPAKASLIEPTEELDRWILSRLNALGGEVTGLLDGYDATAASRRIQAFVDDLSNWYVRRSRRRFWKSESDTDKASAYATLYQCLVTLTKLLAPFTPFIAEEMYRNLVCSISPDAPDSVHLADYPEPDPAKTDEELSRATDLVIKAVSLGRAARNKSKIRVRQPLEALKVATRSSSEREALSRQASHIREELNVKEVSFVEDESELVDIQVQARLDVIGPKYGREIGGVVAAVKQADAATVAPKIRGGTPVEVEGFTLQPHELQVQGIDKPGYAVSADGPLTVAVTTEITPALALEGKARELVHRVQNMRKSAGFDISDRIQLFYQAGDEIGDVFSKHGSYIEQETLAESIVAGPPEEGAFTESQKIDGAQVELAVMRAG